MQRGQHGYRPARVAGYGRLLTAVLLCVIIAPGTATMGVAQTAPAQTYSVAFVGVPVGDALAQLIEETSISIAYETASVQGPLAYCKASGVTAEALLRCVLAGTGLDFIQLSSGTYVIVTDLLATPRLGTLSGRVMDVETGAPLEDANVLIPGEGVGASTNSDGRFAFADLPSGQHRLVITHVAYHDAERSVSITPATTASVSLEMTPRIITSRPIVVSGFERRIPLPELGVGSAPVAGHSPVAVGTRDVIQDVGAISGVQLGAGTADIHVQGGGPNEQPFRLDGIPVFLPIANAGFFGPFSPQAIGNVTVRKAGFGASYGSGLSGVVDLTHSLTASSALSGVAQIDPMSLNLRLNGRTALGNGTNAIWMAGVRRSLWDAWGSGRLETLFANWGAPDSFLLDQLGVTPADSAFSVPASSDVHLTFTNIHLAGRIHFGGFRTLGMTYFEGRNSFGIEEITLADSNPTSTFTDRYDWLNRAGQLRYEWVASNRIFFSVSSWASIYELSHAAIASLQTSDFVEDFNEITQFGGRLDLRVAAAARHHLSVGVDVSNTESNFSFSLDPLGENTVGAGQLRPIKTLVAGHLEDRITVSQATTLTIGSRLTYLPAMERVFLEPRLELRSDRSFGTGRGVALRLAIGRYQQYLNSFDVTTSGIATLLPVLRYWIPVGADDRVPEAYHATAGVIYHPASPWQIGVEGYYKRHSSLLVPDYGGTDDDELTLAKGYSYGGSASLRRESRTLHVEARYEFGRSLRHFPGRFGDGYTAVPWESPHRVFVTVQYSPIPRVTGSARWEGLFGRTWAFRQSYYDYLEPNPERRQYGSVNLSHPTSHALPTFSQIDVGVVVRAEVASVDLQFGASVANILGRENVNDFSLSDEAFGGERRRLARFSTPFLPTVSISASW